MRSGTSRMLLKVGCAGAGHLVSRTERGIMINLGLGELYCWEVPRTRWALSVVIMEKIT